MIFAARKDDILTALARVSKVVKSNPRSVDILQCVRVIVDESVYVEAISSMASVRVKVRDAKVKESGTFVINFDKFKDRLSKSGSLLALDDESGLLKIVSSDDQRLGLQLNNPNEFPDETWVESEEAYGLGKEEFVSLLENAAAVSSAATSLIPAFLQVKIKNQKLWVANGLSYQMFDLACNELLDSSIPTTSLSPLASFINDSVEDTVWLDQGNASKVVITVGSDQFQANPLAVDFPNLEQTFNKVKVSATDELTFDRSAMLGVLGKAKTSADSYGRVYLDMDSATASAIQVSAHNDSGDWFEGKIPGRWMSSGARKLVFNIDALSKILRSFSEDSITVKVGQDFKGDLSAGIISEEGNVAIINQFRI